MRYALLAVACGLVLVACSLRAGQPAARDASLEPALPPSADVAIDGGVRVVLHDSLRTDTYLVNGRTPAELRADLNRTGPLSTMDGRRFDALTSWSLKWGFRYKRVDGGCALAGATVNLDIVVLLPDLADPAALPARNQPGWQAYRDALESHEAGHVELQRKGATDLQAIFASFDGIWPNCRELGQALKAEGDAQINAIYAADRAYDESTSHGRLQGAVFP